MNCPPGFENPEDLVDGGLRLGNVFENLRHERTVDALRAHRHGARIGLHMARSGRHNIETKPGDVRRPRVCQRGVAATADIDNRALQFVDRVEELAGEQLAMTTSMQPDDEGARGHSQRFTISNRPNKLPALHNTTRYLTWVAIPSVNFRPTCRAMRR